VADHTGICLTMQFAMCTN